MLKKTRVKRSVEDLIFDVVIYVFIIIFVIAITYPIIYIISCSFSSSQAVIGGRVNLLPVEFSLEGYKTIFNYDSVWIGYRNTIIYTFVGTFINVIMTILAAYPLSRKDFYGRGIFTFIFTFTMFFSGGLIPTYLLVTHMGMRNSMWALIIPTAVSVWNIIITRTYYQNTIPDELLEAAKLDRCNDFQFVLYIVLPLSGAITAVNVLFYAVEHWNAYFQAMIYLTDEELFPLQLILRKILILNSVDGKMMTNAAAYSAKVGLKELLKYSLIIVSSAPMMILYPFVQKYFVKGVMVGSLKG